ncbi:MAG: hypothetical protein ACRDH0_06425 [Actinomycetota bacterium]
MNRPLTHAGHRPARILLTALAVLLVMTACTPSGGGPRAGEPSGADSSGGGEADRSEPGTVRDLASIATLRDQFSRDAGTVRLILLISPT